jgi:hypothetical protein
MKHLLMAVYQVCSNKSPWFEIGIGPGVYIQVSDFRAIMSLLFICLFHSNHAVIKQASFAKLLLPL